MGEGHERKYDWEMGAIGAMWAWGDIIGGRGLVKRIWVWEEGRPGDSRGQGGPAGKIEGGVEPGGG